MWGWRGEDQTVMEIKLKKKCAGALNCTVPYINTGENCQVLFSRAVFILLNTT